MEDFQLQLKAWKILVISPILDLTYNFWNHANFWKVHKNTSRRINGTGKIYPQKILYDSSKITREDFR